MTSRLPNVSLMALMLALLLGVVIVLASPDVASAHSPHDTIADVELSPSYDQDGTAFAIVREYLLRSTDHGDTWKKLVRGFDNKFVPSLIAVSAQNKRVVYVSTHGDGVYKSVDQGSTWAKVDNGLIGRPNVNVLATSPMSADIVLAGVARAGLFISTTGGSTWRVVRGLTSTTAAAFAPDRQGMVVVGESDGSLRQSVDAGKTWKKLAMNRAGTGSIRSISFSPSYSSDHTLFVGTERGGVFKTTDGGRSFAAMNRDGIDLRIRSVLASPTYGSDSTVWASTWGRGTIKSTDGGASWSTNSRGETTNVQADQLHAPQFGAIVASRGPENARTLFQGGFDGLFRSTNGGAQWQEVQTQSSSEIISVEASPDYGADSTIAVGTYLNGAFLSEDKGTTWKTIDRGLVTRFEWLRRRDYVARLTGVFFAPSYPQDHVMFAGLRGYILRSAGGGSKWVPMTPRGVVVKGEDPPDYFLPAFSPAYNQDHTVLLGTDRGKVFRSTDGGKHFTKVGQLKFEINSFVISPRFRSDKTLFAGTPQRVYTSTDKGATWSPVANLPLPRSSMVTSVAISPNYGADHSLFVGTSAGLFTTNDSGHLWVRLPGEAYGADGQIETVVLSPEYTKDRVMLVSVRGKGLFKSTDAGRSFRAVGKELIDNNFVLSNFYHPTSEPIVFSPRYAIDHTVYGFAEQTLFRSTDRGETWARVKVPRTSHDTTESSAPNKLLVTPRFGRATDSSGVTYHATKSKVITPKRVVAAAVAGLLALVALYLFPVLGRSRGRRSVVSLGAGVVVFLAVVATLAVLR